MSTAQTATLANQRTEIDILGRRMDASVLPVKAVGGWDAAELAKAGDLPGESAKTGGHPR